MSRLAQMLPNRLWQSQFGPYSVTGGSYTQAESGDPSPANIRAISPWKANGASTSVVRVGKNLFDISKTLVKPAGTASVAGNILTYTGIDTTYNACWIMLENGRSMVGKTVTISASVTNTGAADTSFRAMWRNSAGTFSTAITRGYANNSYANTGVIPAMPDAGSELGMLFYAGYAVAPNVGDIATFTNIQFEIASAKTPYEPYISKSCTLTAPELYAGYLGDDWSWRRTHTTYLLNGTETWDDTNFAASGYFETAVTAAHATPALACSHFLASTTAPAADSNKCIIAGTSLKFYPADAVATNKGEWLAWLAANNTRVVYTLATPTVIAPTFP